MRIKIFILYHDENSFLETKSITAYNPEVFTPMFTGKTVFFESNIYNILYNNRNLYENYDVIGFIPYSIRNKMNTSPEKIIEYTSNNIEKYDVVPIFGTNDFIKKRNNVIMPYIDTCAKMHGSHTFIALYKLLSQYYKDDQIMSTNHKGFFCNAFCTRKNILDKYIDFFVNINNKISNDAFIQDMLNRYSYYDGKLSKEELTKISKYYPYYTSHPFFYERLTCLYMNLENYKICAPLVKFVYEFLD